MDDSLRVWSQCSGEGEDALHDQAIERNEAFSELVARQSRLMFRVAYGLLRNAHDAEDVVQETFLKLYRGEAWRAIEDEKAFLARTVWRVALNRASSRSAERDNIEDLELASRDASPEESAASADESGLLRRLIDGLPDEMRQALVLSALEEMNSREVSLVLEIPEGTVRTRLMRAKAELKKRFEAIKGARR
jgi:RNA polymerase sigma-70 factor (ECF subfamily)